MITELNDQKIDLGFSNFLNFQNQQIESNSSRDLISKECKTLRNQLELSKIIDKEGAILKPEELSDLPKLDITQEKLLNVLLESPIIFPFEKESASFPLKKLLEHLYKRHEKEIQSICIKGGVTRRLLLSKPFLSVMLEDLGLDKEKIDQLLNEELLKCEEGPLADIDICFQLFEGADPKELTQTVSESIQTGLLKFCFISDEASNFSIASFEKLDISSICNQFANFPKSSSHSEKEYTNIEILAVKKSRDYLFPLDALAIDITGAVKGEKEHPYFLKSFYQKGHQTILDLIHHIIRIKEPKTINETGYPALLSYLSKGFIAIGDKEILLQTFLKSKNSKQKLFDYFKSHHQNKPDFWIAMLFHLRQTRGTAFIFDSIKKEIDNEEKKFSKPFFELYKYLSEKNFSVDSLNAVLILTALFAKFNESSSASFKNEEEKQFVQFKLTPEGPTLLLPFVPIESYQMFIDLCKKGQKQIIDLANVLFEQFLVKTGNSKNNPPFMFEGSLTFIRMLKEQIATSHEPLFYVSYLLFLSLSSIHQEKELLFQYLPEAIKKAPPAWKKILVKHMSFLFPESPYKEFLMQLDEMALENPENLLKNWIPLLFKSSDKQLLCEILLRKEFENDLPLDIAASFLKKTSWMLSKEQEEKILLRLFSTIPSLTSKERLREIFTLTLNFLHKVKSTKKRCSNEFEKAYVELIKTAFKQEEPEWGKILFDHASRLKLTPVKKTNINSLASISETLFESQKNQKAIDPFLLILAPQTAEKEEENNKITYWIEKRIQTIAKEDKLSKLGLRLLSLSSKRFSEKKWNAYALLFYEKACVSQESQIALNLLKTLLKNGFCGFENELFGKKTDFLLNHLFFKKRESCFDFIQTLLPEKSAFVIFFFPSFSPLLSIEHEEKILSMIFQENSPSIPLNALFNLAENFLKRVNQKKILFTKEFKEAYTLLIEKMFQNKEIDSGKTLLKKGFVFQIGPVVEKNSESLMRISEMLFENKENQKVIDRFLILLAPENKNSKIIDWVKTRLKARISNKKFSPLDIKLLNASEKQLSKQELYDHTLLFYEKACKEQEFFAAAELLKKLLENLQFNPDNEIFARATNSLFETVLSKHNESRKNSKNQNPSHSKIDPLSLLELFFQQKESPEVQRFPFFLKHAVKILALIKQSVNLDSETKEKITEQFLIGSPNENPETEFEILAHVMDIQKKKSQYFYKRMEKLFLNLLASISQTKLFENVLSLLYQPKESEHEWWEQVYLSILSKIDTVKKLELLWSVFYKVATEQSSFKEDIILYVGCWTKIIQTFRKFKHFPAIVLENASKELKAIDFKEHIPLNPRRLRQELEAYLLESDASEYFESALYSIEQRMTNLPANFLLLLHKGSKQNAYSEKIYEIVKKAIVNPEFSTQVDLVLFVKALLNYRQEPFFEESLKFLILILTKSKENKSSAQFFQTLRAPIELFVKRLKLPEQKQFALPLLKHPCFALCISSKVYTKFCSEILIDYALEYYEMTQDIQRCYALLSNIYKKFEADPKIKKKWSKAVAYCLVHKMMQDPVNWSLFSEMVEKAFEMTKKKAKLHGIVKTITKNPNEEIKKFLSGNQTVLIIPNKLSFSKKGNLMIPEEQNPADQILLSFTLLNELLNHEYDTNKFQLNYKIQNFFGKHFPINEQVSSKDKRKLVELLQKFLFWKPYSIEDTNNDHPISHNSLVMDLYAHAFDKGYFKEIPECNLLFFLAGHFLGQKEQFCETNQKSADMALLYIKKTIRDNSLKSFIHCFELLKNNPFLEKFRESAASLYSIFLKRAFYFPLFRLDDIPVFVHLIEHLLNGRIKKLVDQYKDSPENLYPLADELMENGLVCLEKISLSSDDLYSSTFLSLSLLCIVTECMDSFSKERKKYYEFLNKCAEMFICFLKVMKHQDGTVNMGRDAFEKIQDLNEKIQKKFSNEEEFIKIQRERLTEIISDLWNTILNSQMI